MDPVPGRVRRVSLKRRILAPRSTFSYQDYGAFRGNHIHRGKAPRHVRAVTCRRWHNHTYKNNNIHNGSRMTSTASRPSRPVPPWPGRPGGWWRNRTRGPLLCHPVSQQSSCLNHHGSKMTSTASRQSTPGPGPVMEGSRGRPRSSSTSISISNSTSAHARRPLRSHPADPAPNTAPLIMPLPLLPPQTPLPPPIAPQSTSSPT